MKILVIDDEPGLRHTITATLNFAGYETRATSDVFIGLQIAAEEHPDLIITDLMMSEMAGYEFLEAVRHNPRTRDIPVILVSAVTQRALVRQALALGACEYVPKPFAVEELLSAVEAVV